MAKAYLDAGGRFYIENYHQSKLMAGFFPGIAGPAGVPIWAYYVNRGQALAGFGYSDKDGALQEFVPLDKAPWYAAHRGFRTFIKIGTENGEQFYEPFQMGNQLRWNITTRMEIEASEITIVELNHDLQIEVQVTYFTLPGDPVGGLYRKTALINHRSSSVQIRMADGLAILLPAGYNNFWAKNMGATIRAWMTVNVETGIPLYQLKYLADDVPELLPVKHRHFFFGYRVTAGGVEHLPPLYDPAVLFGEGTDYAPIQFEAGSFTYPRKQSQGNHLASAMSYLETVIPAGDSASIYGLYGRVSGVQELEQLIQRIDLRFFERHRERNRILVQEIKDYAFTSSGLGPFDRYLGQSFLDNVIRGGLPVTINQNQKSPRVFWLYSRKHGDLERDYNDFQLSPTYYSQGNGNFRDINQNRRNDLWFNTGVKDSVLHYFWNLMQLDGYNPLIVKGIIYHYPDMAKLRETLAGKVSADLGEKICALLEKPFTPGELAHFLEREQGESSANDGFLFTAIIENATETGQAEYREGYWTDHWTYNLDLWDSFMSIYPDKARAAAWERSDYTFYDSPAILAPLAERFVLEQDRVFARKCVRMDPEKQSLIQQRHSEPNQVRADFGRGAIYHTTLWVKMLTVALNKLASFDPVMAGLEMDTGRPGWCDAVNGLPAIFGSSVPEVFALKRLLQQLFDILNSNQTPAVSLPVEIAEFLNSLEKAFEIMSWSQTITQTEKYRFWKETHQVRDHFLQEVRLGISGQEVLYNITQLSSFITQAKKLVTEATGRSYQPGNGLYHTYYYYKVTQWTVLKGDDTVAPHETSQEIHVWPEKFEQCFLPEFLEGQVAALRTTDGVQPDDLYQAVRGSGLFDTQLEMYKVCADLSQAPDELGRIRVFPRGWLENESIFLHMEYKYLLELLRRELWTEFFGEFFKLLVCFLDPEIYGRSPLENSSFLVSSANPEPDYHGNGFIARLSGSTAEMINLWLWMSFGFKPFRTKPDGRLLLEFSPMLTESFFSTCPKQVKIHWGNGQERNYNLPENCYAARFLGTTLVMYHNPSRKPTVGHTAARIRRITIQSWNGENISVDGSVIEMEMAEKIRSGWAEKIFVEMG